MWKQELPLALKCLTASELNSMVEITDTQTHMYRVILTLRCLDVQMLLYRVGLSHLLEVGCPSTEATSHIFTFETAAVSLNICVEAADNLNHISICTAARYMCQFGGTRSTYFSESCRRPQT